MKIGKLDFSEYHPLDHSVFECKGYPGGKRRHLQYRWEFQVEPAISAAFHKPLCAVGLHDSEPWWQGSEFGEGVKPKGYMCRHCRRKLNAP